VYGFVGQYVASPALGSAGAVMKRVCYGLALPGLLVSTVLYAHVSFFATRPNNEPRLIPQLPAKYLFVRILRGSEHLSSNTVKHWIVWLSSVTGCILFSYVVASAIPVFGGLVNLIGASLGTLVCIQAFVCPCPSIPLALCPRVPVSF
jgi:cbb3-type cytochrome oxidase subunit 1